MTKEQVKNLAIELMEKWGLIDLGWRFQFLKSASTIGRCNYAKKLILYSTLWIDDSEEEITDTLLHEIAHALAGYEAGHGKVWKEWCLKVGARPERLKREHGFRPQRKWITYCPSCGQEYGRTIRPKQSVLCGSCPSKGWPITYNSWKLNTNYKT